MPRVFLCTQRNVLFPGRCVCLRREGCGCYPSSAAGRQHQYVGLDKRREQDQPTPGVGAHTIRSVAIACSRQTQCLESRSLGLTRSLPLLRSVARRGHVDGTNKS